MPRMKNVVVLIFSLLIFACQTEPAPKKESVVMNASIEIGGMTCEIGCANLIESKMIKAKGIQEVTVVFEDSIGTVKYDKNQISEQEIVEIIENIAGGDLYEVKSIVSTPETPSIP